MHGALDLTTGRGSSDRRRFALSFATAIAGLISPLLCHAQDSAWVELVRGAGGERVPQALQVIVDGRPAGLLAAVPGASSVLALREAPPGDPHEVRLSSLDGAYGFRLQLAVAPGRDGISVVGSVSTEACASLVLRPSVLRLPRGPQQLQLHFDASGAAPAGPCLASARALGPATLWKIRFISQPAGASLFLPERHLRSIEYRRVDALTPVVYISEVAVGRPLRVFFKKPGYEDCVRVLSLQQRREGPMLQVGSGSDTLAGEAQPLVQDPVETQVPQVHCELRAVTAPP